MTQKFYLHTATSGATGTLPGASSQSGTTPSVTSSGATTNRTMDGTIGSSQVSQALTTLAQTGAQQNWMTRHISNPLAAQTIAAGTWTLSAALSQSNTASAVKLELGAIYIWRPGTGTKVGNIFTPAAGSSGPASTAEAAVSATGSGASITIQNGDLLVVEVWTSNTQTMATAYTNTFFYDGTTEASSSSCASYLNAPADIPLQPVAPTARSLTLNTVSSTVINITWTADSAAYPQPTYAIWQSTDGVSFTQIATGQTGQTNFIAQQLSNANQYWFYIIGSNSGGSAQSATAGPIRPPTPVAKSYNFDAGSSGANIQTTDTGSGTSFDAVGSQFTPTYNNTQAHSGTQSMASTGGLSSAASTVTWNISTKSILYARFYLYLTALPASGVTWRLCTIVGSASNMDVWINNTGQIFLQSGGTNGSLSQHAIPLNQWVRIEIGITSIGTAVTIGTLRLYLNADSFLLPDDMSSMNTTAQFQATTIVFGEFSTAANQSTIWMDDLAVSDANWLGPSVSAPANTVIVANPAPTPSAKTSATSGSLPAFWPNAGSTYLLVTGVQSNGSGSPAATVTGVSWSSGGSGSWGASPLVSYAPNAFSPQVAIWAVHCTANPGPSVIALTGSSAVIRIFAALIEITGDNYAALLGASANTNGATATVALTPTYTGSWIVGSILDWFEPFTPTPNAATALDDSDSSGGQIAVALGSVASTVASTAQTIGVTNTITSGGAACLAAEIRAAVAAAGSPLPALRYRQQPFTYQPQHSRASFGG